MNSLIYIYVSPLLISYSHPTLFFFFFFNDTATTEIYTLSLHDALPISSGDFWASGSCWLAFGGPCMGYHWPVTSTAEDRKSTRLNSSHLVISYAVFCLKKKKNKNNHHLTTELHK